MKKSITTDYGFKKIGKSRFVVIAPHAAGDDLKTSIVAIMLADKLKGFVVVNKKYFKPINHKAKIDKKYIEDFNKLRWSKKNECYLWKNKKPAMKEFFDDVIDCSNQARGYSEEKKAVAVYIHGIRNKKIGIDLGVGLKTLKGKNKFTYSAKDVSPNSGLIAIKFSQLKKIRETLQKNLELDYNLSVSVGKKFIGWSKQSAVQFHKNEGRNDYAIQLEINRFLRKEENLSYLIDLLTETLEETFK